MLVLSQLQVFLMAASSVPQEFRTNRLRLGRRAGTFCSSCRSTSNHSTSLFQYVYRPICTYDQSISDKTGALILFLFFPLWIVECFPRTHRRTHETQGTGFYPNRQIGSQTRFDQLVSNCVRSSYLLVDERICSLICSIVQKLVQ